jgi:hypothetical protein
MLSTSYSSALLLPSCTKKQLAVIRGCPVELTHGDSRHCFVALDARSRMQTAPPFLSPVGNLALQPEQHSVIQAAAAEPLEPGPGGGSMAHICHICHICQWPYIGPTPCNPFLYIKNGYHNASTTIDKHYHARSLMCPYCGNEPCCGQLNMITIPGLQVSTSHPWVATDRMAAAMQFGSCSCWSRQQGALLSNWVARYHDDTSYVCMWHGPKVAWCSATAAGRQRCTALSYGAPYGRLTARV